MINKFSYLNTTNNTVLELKLGACSIIKTEDYSNGKFDSYFDGGEKGLFWYNNNDKFILEKKGYNVTGIPSIDLKYVIVVFFNKGESYPGFNNGYIYNANGSIYKKLIVPKLISELSKTHYRKIMYPQTMYFDSVNWQLLNSEYVVIMKIGYNGYWYEERVLNPETGEFGECVGSGRF